MAGVSGVTLSEGVIMPGAEGNHENVSAAPPTPPPAPGDFARGSRALLGGLPVGI
jgi:hypothetical protein